MIGSTSSSALDLSGTHWQAASDRYDVDPHLLYSIALIESRRPARIDATQSHPWLYTLNIDGTPHYLDSRQEAVALLSDTLAATPDASIDVGPMQISLKWHAHRVETPADLFDLGTATHVGAAILSDALASSQADAELGIGRYHAWSNEQRSRRYGSEVLAVYHAIDPFAAKKDRRHE